VTDYLLFAFDSTHAAISAQRALRDLNVTLMPTLREITASCGMSLRLARENGDAAVGILNAEGIGEWTLYSIHQEGKNITATRL